MKTGNRDLIKAINRNIVLNLIKSEGPLSRTKIAQVSGLSLATISGLTGELLGDGFIQETGEGESTGGRPPVLLRLNRDAGLVVGLKLTENAIVSAITDLEANVLYSEVTSFAVGHGAAASRKAIAQAVEATLAHFNAPRAKVMGVGIGLAGVIDSRAGVCRYSPILGWRDVSLARPLEEQLRLPVYIENDVNTLTIAEQWFGSGHGVEDFLVVTVGRGVGLGIVANGQFYRGWGGGAGEFGHITIAPDGPRCDCGKRGCLEAVASDPAVLREVQQAIASGAATTLTNAGQLTLAAVAEAAEQEDLVARDALAHSGRALGFGLAHLVNIFSPQLIVLAGEGLVAGEARLGPMREALEQHTFAGLRGQTRLVVEPSGDVAWSRGAACVVLGELFKHPFQREERAALLS